MKIASLFATIAIVIAPLFALPAAADTATLQAALKAAYMSQCALVMAGNFDDFGKTMTADYVHLGPDGKAANRDQVIAALKQNAQVLKVTSCDISFIGTTQNADGSVDASVFATQKGQIVSTQNGQPASASPPLLATSTSTDTWVQQGGAWLLKSSKVSELTVKVNGNVVQHLGGSAASPSPAPPS